MPALKSSYALLVGDCLSYEELRKHLDLPVSNSSDNPFQLVMKIGYKPVNATSVEMSEYCQAMKTIDYDQPNNAIHACCKSYGTASAEWDRAYTFVTDRSQFRDKCRQWIKANELDAAGIIAAQALDDPYSPWEVPSKITVSKAPKTITANTVIENPAAIKAFHEYIYGASGLDEVGGPRLGPHRYTYTLFRELFDTTKKTVTRKITYLTNVCPKIETRWTELENPTQLKTRGDLAKLYRMVRQATATAANIGNEAYPALNKMLETLESLTENGSQQDYIARRITFFDPERTERIRGLFSDDEIASLQSAIRRDALFSTYQDSLDQILSNQPPVVNALAETTFGIEAVAHMDTPMILKRLKITDDQYLPYVNRVVPVQGWSALAAMTSVASDRRLLQQLAEKTWENWEKKAAVEGIALPDVFEIQNDSLEGPPLSSHREATLLRWMPLKPRWVQLVGVLVVLQHLVSPDAAQPNGTPGFMINDDVGLGKTGLAVMIISMLAYMIDLQREQLDWPPFCGLREQKNLLFGHVQLENEPFLIVVPPALFRQWYEQLQTWLGSYFEIHCYERFPNSRPDWFGPNSTTSGWANSKLPAHRKIILATTTAISKDGSLALDLSAKRNCRSEALPFKRSYLTGLNVVLQHSFTMVIIDEIHNFHGSKQGYEAALVLRDRAKFMLGLSATPLFSGPRDLHTIGRILNLPGLIGLDADIWEEHELAQQRAFNRLSSRAHSELSENASQSLVPPIFGHITHLKGRLDPYRIRRTRQSRGEYGVKGTITGLKELWEVKMILPTEAWEVAMVSEALAEEHERIKPMKPSGPRPKTLRSQSMFFLRERQGALSPTFVLDQVRGTEHSLFLDQDDFMRRASTKLRMMIRIVTHHAKPNHWQANPLTLSKRGRDGVVYKKRDPAEPSVSMTKPPRIVIYLEFVKLMDEVQSAFELYGIKVLVLKGKMPDSQRLKVLREFEQYTDVVVLLTSPVAQEGLNLHMANIIVVSTPTFTYQEMVQIIGRVHRQPQRYQTIAYKLYAKDTADITLLRLASRRQGIEKVFNPTEIEYCKAYINDADPEALGSEEEDYDVNTMAIEEKTINLDPKGADWVGIEPETVEEPKFLAEDNEDIHPESIGLGQHIEQYDASVPSLSSVSLIPSLGLTFQCDSAASGERLEPLKAEDGDIDYHLFDSEDGDPENSTKGMQERPETFDLEPADLLSINYESSETSPARYYDHIHSPLVSNRSYTSIVSEESAQSRPDDATQRLSTSPLNSPFEIFTDADQSTISPRTLNEDSVYALPDGDQDLRPNDSIRLAETDISHRFDSSHSADQESGEESSISSNNERTRVREQIKSKRRARLLKREAMKTQRPAVPCSEQNLTPRFKRTSSSISAYASDSPAPAEDARNMSEERDALAEWGDQRPVNKLSFNMQSDLGGYDTKSPVEIRRKYSWDTNFDEALGAIPRITPERRTRAHQRNRRRSPTPPSDSDAEPVIYTVSKKDRV